MRILLPLLLLSSFTFGQVVYVNYFDAVYSHPIPPPSQYITHTFDLNNDGEMDIDLYFEGLGVSSTFCDGQLLNNELHYIYFNGVLNSFGENNVNCTVNPSIGYGVDCDGDTLDINDVWHNSAMVHKGGFLTEPICYSLGYANHKQGFRLLVPNPANNQNAYIYGYVDYTITSNGDVIIHGWYYESQFNTPIVVGGSGTASLEELNTGKELIKVVDLLGREVQPEPNKVLIYHY